MSRSGVAGLSEATLTETCPYCGNNGPCWPWSRLYSPPLIKGGQGGFTRYGG